jgi:hypothetical protein
LTHHLSNDRILCISTHSTPDSPVTDVRSVSASFGSRRATLFFLFELVRDANCVGGSAMAMNLDSHYISGKCGLVARWGCWWLPSLPTEILSVWRHRPPRSAPCWATCIATETEAPLLSVSVLLYAVFSHTPQPPPSQHHEFGWVSIHIPNVTMPHKACLVLISLFSFSLIGVSIHHLLLL